MATRGNERIAPFVRALKAHPARAGFATAQTLQSALDHFMRWYNEFPPNRGFDGLVPKAAWQGRPMTDLPVRAMIVGIAYRPFATSALPLLRGASRN
ncbi:MAG TPA: hypothetical protein VIP05_07420, partial [Burkholderiaceae bacterium]